MSYHNSVFDHGNPKKIGIKDLEMLFLLKCDVF